MPTIMSHPAPMIALAAGLGASRISPRLAIAAIACAILPDLDVIGFKYGVAYANILGHRGLSHSLIFAIGIGICGFLSAPILRCKRWLAFSVLFAAVASHILLDAATNGGLGVAALWPFSEERYFLPWRPIRVSPFSPRAFLGERGFTVLRSEFIWVWCPCVFAAILLKLTFRKKRSC